MRMKDGLSYAADHYAWVCTDGHLIPDREDASPESSTNQDAAELDVPPRPTGGRPPDTRCS